MFCEKKFTLGEFTPMSMKNCGCRNVRKHRDINDIDNYINLDISLKVFSLEKINIKSSELNDYQGRPGKGLITYLGLKTILRLKKDKKSRYAITNVIMKDLSKIINEF